VERNNAQELGKALSWVLSNPESATRLGSEARARIIDRFSWRRSAEILVQYALAPLP